MPAVGHHEVDVGEHRPVGRRFHDMHVGRHPRQRPGPQTGSRGDQRVAADQPDGVDEALEQVLLRHVRGAERQQDRRPAVVGPRRLPLDGPSLADRDGNPAVDGLGVGARGREVERHAGQVHDAVGPPHALLQ